MRILARAGYRGSVDLELPAEEAGKGPRDAGSDDARLAASLAYLREAAYGA
jgi:hypothetical protein